MKASDNVIQEYFSALLGESAEPVGTASSTGMASADRKVVEHTSAKPSSIQGKLTTTSSNAAESNQRLAKHSSQKPSAKSLSSLDEPKVSSLPKVATAPLQKLLDGVAHTDVKPVEKVKPKVATPSPVEQEAVQAEPELELEVQSTIIEQASTALTAQPPIPEEDFQVLYFDVAGMTLAVPLEQLGGIYNITDDSVRQLFGKPGWLMGLMPYRERQLNVVDTALWVMPEKYDEELAEKLNYQYLVMLKDSEWGLACEKLVTTSQLMPSETNWRQTMGKRPWLRGMVKEKMCALLNVDALIELLDTGLNSQNT